VSLFLAADEEQAVTEGDETTVVEMSIGVMNDTEMES
jgi:hypothetical protein